MVNKGKLLLCFLMATGLVMTSAGIYVANSGTGWAAPAEQEVSKRAKEGLSIFENVTNTNTNLTGWQIKGKGKLADTVEGMLLTSDPQENVMAISETVSEDFIYEADVMIKDMQADATLLFRSNEDGWGSYMLQIVPNAGMIRLRDA